MYFVTIFYPGNRLDLIDPAFESLSTCMDFLKAFMSHVEPAATGAACLSQEVLNNLGIIPI